MKKQTIFHLDRIRDMFSNTLANLEIDLQNSECIGFWRNTTKEEIKETKAEITSLNKCIKWVKKLNPSQNQ